MDKNVYRISTLSTFLGNILYLIIIYNLWKAIFAGSPSELINGMNFKDTFIYLAISYSMQTTFCSFTDWYISYGIVDGRIIHDFLKPMNYQTYVFLYIMGDVLSNFIFIFIPSFIMILVVSGDFSLIGARIPFYLIAMLLAMCINFIIDFFVGTICFYTESTWGLNMVKTVIVSLLSGAIVPIPFFPESIRSIVECLPFHAISNLPVQVLINDSYKIADYFRIFGIQIFWLIILTVISQLFFKHASKVVVVNGG